MSDAVRLAHDYMRMCDERRASGVTGSFVYADYPTEAQHELAAAVLAQAEELANLRAALRDALDGWHREHGDDYPDHPIYKLRRLADGE